MPISPRYGDAPVITIPGAPRDQLEPLVRQRRRLQAVLENLAPSDWTAPSRCAGWSIQDVVAHLAGVNGFWAASVRAGLAGTPTRLLAGFDPVETPEHMVAAMRELEPQAVLGLFAASNDELVRTLDALDDAGWAATAEAPPGHLSVRLLASHALWDAWIHERDIVLPLGGVPPLEGDEVAASLRYVSALTAALVVLSGGAAAPCSYGVVATGPEVRFVLDVGDRVEVRDVAPEPSDATLRGDAVELTDALSCRTPYPSTPPEEWARITDGFAAVFSSSRVDGVR